MADTPAESSSKSLPAPNANGLTTRRSARDVVLRLTTIDVRSLSPDEHDNLTMLLLVMFKGLLENTFSDDRVELAKYRACQLLDGVVDKDEVLVATAKLIRGMRRKPNPLDGLF